MLKWGADDLPAVVCVHTTGGHARRFERLARMLEPNRRVIAYDLRGHGRSPWSGPQTPAQHVADLDHVLDASGVDQVTIIGHGLGARIAVEHACEYGERATALVLLDPLILTPATTLLLLAERERGRGGFATISDAIEAERSESGLMHTPSALLEEEMAEHLVAGEDGLYRYRYSREAAASALSHAAEFTPDLRAVVCPDADHPRRGVRARERGRGRPGGGRASPWPGRDRARRSRRAVGCAGRDQRAGARVRADSDACMSLRLRPMTAAGVRRLAGRGRRGVRRGGRARHAADPEQAARQVGNQLRTLLPDGVETPNHSVYVFEDEDGSAVGQLWIAEERIDGRGSAVRLRLEITQAERGRGFGREAMLLVEAEARARGLDRIELNVWPTNHVAHALYRSLEFEETSLGMVKLLGE